MTYPITRAREIIAAASPGPTECEPSSSLSNLRYNEFTMKIDYGGLDIGETDVRAENIGKFVVAAASPTDGWLACADTLEEATGLLRDVWAQFSLEGTVKGQKVRHDGGLSTLEDVAAFLGIETPEKIE